MEIEKVIERFNKKRDAGDIKDCWFWKGAIDHTGYGRFGIARNVYSAHRVAYVLHYRKQPNPDLIITHTCNNRHCVNPYHLFETTREAAMMLHCGGQKHYKSFVPDCIKRKVIEKTFSRGENSGYLMRLLKSEYGYEIKQATASNWLNGRD